jgi:hypothetical protein
MSSFLDALTPLVDACDALGIAYYIGGSVASIAHGVPRTTLDVDVIADIRPGQVRQLVARLQGSYYIQAADIQDAIQQRSSFNLVHLASMIKVDVFLAPNRPFDRSKAQRVQTGPITASDPRPFRLTSPEDIVLQKLERYAMGGRVSERQWNDSQGVLKVQGTTLDLAYLRHWATELGISDLLEQALKEAGLAA